MKPRIYLIDYENVSPETRKEWEKEFRNKFRREMRQYLKRFPDATPEEKRDLITRNVMKAGEAHRKRTFGVKREEK